MTKTDLETSLRVCVIEDDDDTRATLVDILELDDYVVNTFHTFQEASQAEAFAQADIVLLDRKLPDGFAEAVLPKLKRLANDAQFIVVTGYADMTAAIAALREGVSDFLIKPIDPDDLRARLARLTQNRVMERELRQQRRFAEKLLETAEAIVLVLDTNGIVKRTNPYLLELTGYVEQEVIGTNWFDKFILPDDREHVTQVFRQTVEQIKTRGIINPILTKSGRSCEIRWSNSTLRNERGETEAVLSVGLDVTDFIAAQERVVQNERLAAIGTTMTGLAHESRNALQRMQNAVDLLQNQFQDDPDVLHDLNKVERAGKHIRDLLEEVRSYAAPVNLCLEQKTMPAIWRRAWRSLQHQKLIADGELVERVPDELNAKAVQVDPRRIEQVFRNLFENAKDAVAPADQLRVQISLSTEENALRIDCLDNGTGVPEEQRQHLFEAFSTTKPTGTGLGLAICRRILDAHGGTIELAASELGAHFVIRLPS